MAASDAPRDGMAGRSTWPGFSWTGHARPRIYAEAGYAVLLTEMIVPRLALRDFDPLLRAGLAWRCTDSLQVDLGVASFSEQEASYFFRTLFELGARLKLGEISFGATGTIIYSDFFTQTAYMDGFSLRVAASFPL
jgi:hypothetical protein